MNNCEKCGHPMKFHYLVGIPVECDFEIPVPGRRDPELCGCVHSIELLVKEADERIDDIEEIVDRTVASWRDESLEHYRGN